MFDNEMYARQQPGRFGTAQPYGYDMVNTLPGPMPGMNTNQIPSLYPSTLTPNLSSQTFMPNDLGGKPSYAKGGVVKYAKGGHLSLAAIAELLRQQGTGPDKILAHIDPYEAMQLAAQSGAPTINPQTNLPQYGFLKKATKLVKKAAGVAAPFVGGALGGPSGAALGGALGGALMGKKNNMLRNSLIGAGLGFAGAGGLGNLGGLGRIIPGVNQGVSGMMQGKGLRGLGNIFNGGFTGGGAGSATSTGAGGLGNILNSGMIDNALLATMVGGTLLGKRKVPHEQSLAENVNQSGFKRQTEDRRVRPTDRVLRIMEQDDDQNGVPERVFFEDVNPGVQYMAHGGYLDGDTGGQDDTIPARLSDGEYVISADVVSGLGDGNNRRGAQKLDKLMSSVRTHKYSKGGRGLPPKAKSLSSYMKGRGK